MTNNKIRVEILGRVFNLVSGTEADSIRSQLVEYSKELSNATATIKKLQKEINQLKLGSQEKRTHREYTKHDKYDGATLQQ